MASIDPVTFFFLLFTGTLCTGSGYLGSVQNRRTEAHIGQNKDEGSHKTSILRQQRLFLFVYAFAVSAELIQDQYSFKLYSYYGLGKGEIGLLFIFGPLASATAVLGTLVGGISDKIGRKRICLAYCALVLLSALSKHLSNYNVLLLGRILEGIALSVLFTTFEAWILSEHENSIYEETRNQTIVSTLSFMSFTQSASLALWVVATPWIIPLWNFLAPFNLASIFASITMILVIFILAENRGASKPLSEETENKKKSLSERAMNFCSHFGLAWMVLISSRKLYLIGILQTSFETMIYIFMLRWLPQLEASAGKVIINRKFVLASFLLAQMTGSLIFKISQREITIKGKTIPYFPLKPERVLMSACIMAILANCVGGLISSSQFALMISYTILNISIGVYFPSIAFLRYKSTPSEVRAVLLNYLRIPFCFLQVLAMLNVGYMSSSSLLLCSISLVSASMVAAYFLEATINSKI